MLPNYRAWDVKKRLKNRDCRRNEHKELKKVVDAFEKSVDTYNRRKERYEAMDEDYMGKDEFYKTRKEYEHDLPLLKATCDKNGMDVYNFGKMFGLIKPTEVGYIKDDKEQGKSAFRSGDSQGKSMIRNMNRMTGAALKRFQK